MALVLEYSNTKDDLRVQHEFKLKDHFTSTRLEHSQKVFLWFCVLMVACYCAYQAEQIGILVMFIFMAGYYLYESLPYFKFYKSSIEKSLENHVDTQVKMEVRDDGLLETEEGIQSFVPWTSIKSYTLYRERLFINLTAGLCSIIPRDSVTPNSAAVDDLIRILQVKGICESPP